MQWFIGFAEGDGAILSYKGQPQFVIKQKEGKILYEIQSVLGFGTVRYFPSRNGYYRYIVTDSKSILLLCLLFLPRGLSQGFVPANFPQCAVSNWL